MSEVRFVKYNEDLFKIPSGTQKRKKINKPPIKIKPISTKTIKHKILDEIRKNQDKQLKLISEAKTTVPTSKTSFDDDFQKSVEYMQTFADKHKEESKLNKSIKNNVVTATSDNNSFSENLVYDSPKKFPSVSYGCLKNGNLPTYRNYCNRTLKQTSSVTHTQIATSPTSQVITQPLVASTVAQPLVASSVAQPLVPSTVAPSKPTISERIKSPAELLLIEKVKQKSESTKPKPIHNKMKKILRRTYRTGKDKYRPRVSVLLPNKTIRRNVTSKSYLLKQTPIDEIRKTLLKQGFIKIGSTAPNDVLRKMYESIQLIGGDIKNHNPDNLLYNFFNDKAKY